MTGNMWPSRLREAREKAGVGQRELARELDVDPKQVWQWEQDETNLTEQTVQRYCAALGMQCELVIKRRRRGARKRT